MGKQTFFILVVVYLVRVGHSSTVIHHVINAVIVVIAVCIAGISETVIVSVILRHEQAVDQKVNLFIKSLRLGNSRKKVGLSIYKFGSLSFIYSISKRSLSHESITVGTCWKLLNGRKKNWKANVLSVSPSIERAHFVFHLIAYTALKFLRKLLEFVILLRQFNSHSFVQLTSYSARWSLNELASPS